MRLRKKKWAQPLLDSQIGIVVKELDRVKGNWKIEFYNNNPINLEIGMGKGEFITTLAKMNPEINYVGIELSGTIAAIALKKVIDMQLTNVRIINIDAMKLDEIFDEGEVSKIYLNFSDPWPKNRHTKKRLTYKSFLDTYKKILVENGVVCFKTDNDQLFDYSVESFKENGWTLNSVNKDYPLTIRDDDVPTEYEKRFREMNKNINRLVAIK